MFGMQMLRACILTLGAAATAKTIKIGVLVPQTQTGARDVYLQSAVTGHYCPASHGYCSANLAARHVSAKDPAVVPTIANLTGNLTVELVHYDSEMSERASLSKFFSMVRRDPVTPRPCDGLPLPRRSQVFTEAIDAVITDGSFITDYVSMLGGISQIKMPVCSALATHPDLSVARDYPYLALMRTTDIAAARAMCNLVVSYGWAAVGEVPPLRARPRHPRRRRRSHRLPTARGLYVGAGAQLRLDVQRVRRRDPQLLPDRRRGGGYRHLVRLRWKWKIGK